MGDMSGPVMRSLARVAERHGDPVDIIYAELFRRYPDTHALFVLDTTGAVRGNMLANVVAVLDDLETDRRYGLNMLRAEMQTHDNLGVPPQLFLAFFDVLRTVTAEALDGEWTAAMAADWDALIALARTAEPAGAA